MNHTGGNCDPTRISRFLDHELDQEEYDRIAGHIETCPFCRKTLNELTALSGMVKDHIRDNWSETIAGSVEEEVLASIQQNKAPWLIKARELFLSKKILIPLTTTAALLLFLSVFFRSPSQTGPSAIVTSLSGNMTSVIIMETPQTHQTILWFDENTSSERQKL